MPWSEEFWDREEALSRKELEELQFKRLKQTIKRAYENVEFFRKRLKSVGLTPDDIKSFEDFAKVPFTTKEHFVENYPFGLIAVPKSEIVRIHTSSGTSGKPKVVAYTANDVETWTNLVARCLYMVGVRKWDVFQNMANYAFFTGGLGIHMGAERIGAVTIPAGVGNTERQVRYMVDFGTTAVHSTPSYALHVKEVAEEMGLIDKLKLRIGCFGAEPWSENTRKRLEDAFGIDAYDSYGLSEMNGPGVAFECREKQGLHIWIDHYFVELIDPRTGERVGEGEKGELVLTPLTKEAMPLLRYRTGDVTMLETDKCSCGRAHPRLMRIFGRSDDMLIVRGINVFPSQIEHVLMQIPEVGDNFQILLTRKGALDEITVRVEVKDEFFTGEIEDLKKLQQKIQRALQGELMLRTNVELVEKGSIERSMGKAKRVVDLRSI
ncbi:MAG: phenylacetate--CoA ligase [Archaeoglobaceae archaeon]|uniref:Phenylacetate--CoA ligase family protein n=1 Tax=Archaeoglobus fulgidus TaxID=2234 RepID=A0A7J3M062_ARCFL